MAIGHSCKEVREGGSISDTKTSRSSQNKMETNSQNDNQTKDRLRKKLISRLDESGWRHRMRLEVQDIVHEKGYEKATIEDIVQELAPKASSLIPDDIKRELIIEAKQSLKETDYS